MPAPIDEIIKRKVIQQWLSGDLRPRIAIDNNIGEGTVGSIINYFKIGLDAAEFDSSRELALQAKKQGLNLSELAANFRLHNFIKTSGAAEEDIESFITNINSGDVSSEQSIPLDQAPNYIEKKLEEKKKIDDQIKEADATLQSKNVSIEAINEHLKLNEKLNEYNLSFHDIDKLLNVLVNAKENGFDAKKIV
jgi:uncharacterized protein (UPF0335 family)